jgi:Xaa-Pro aminopeptidase
MPFFRELAEEWNLRSAIIYVDADLPAHMLLRMQEVLPAALFKSGAELISGLMRKKDADELALMQKAADIADEALMPAVNQIKSGMTELQLDSIIKEEMQKRGGKPTFCIIAAGANGAEPHHESDNTPIKEGDLVLLDYGCSVNGYNSDTTRVVCFGNADEEAKKVYKVVMASQQAGRDAIRAGVSAQEIDRAARKVIEDAGYGEFFMHRTGHGIGLRGHEDPYIVEGNARALEVGECFSIEPGIYLKGRFGVRIENIVTPTEGGHTSFNEEPAAELLEISDL